MCLHAGEREEGWGGGGLATSANRNDEFTEPNIDMHLVLLLKPAPPEHSVIPAALQRGLQGRRSLSEHHRIPPVPKVPEAKQEEGGRRGIPDDRSHVEEMEITDLAGAWVEANKPPETGGEAAAEEKVVRRLGRHRAARAASTGGVDDLFVEKDVTGVHSRHGRKPGEEFHVGRGDRTPKKTRDRRRDPSEPKQPVRHPNGESAMRSATEDDMPHII